MWCVGEVFSTVQIDLTILNLPPGWFYYLFANFHIAYSFNSVPDVLAMDI